MNATQTTSTDLMLKATQDLVADGLPHRAGELYESFVNQAGGIGADGEPIPRKVYESFLRLQVLREAGLLKRLSFGVYQKREDPMDRGELSCRKSRVPVHPNFTFDQCDEEIFKSLMPDAQTHQLSMQELVDDAYILAANIRSTLGSVCLQTEAPEQERSEFQSLKNSTLKHIDAVISGLTAAIVWQDDRLEEQASAEQSVPEMQFGY